MIGFRIFMLAMNQLIPVSMIIIGLFFCIRYKLWYKTGLVLFPVSIIAMLLL